MFKEDEQFYKEQATMLAIKNELALFDRGLEVFGIKTNGSIILISKSDNESQVWDTALRSLKKIYGKRLFNFQ